LGPVPALFSYDSTGSGTFYAYVPPVLNSSRVYTETIGQFEHDQ